MTQANTPTPRSKAPTSRQKGRVANKIDPVRHRQREEGVKVQSP
jgi:hypothetical protein